MDIDFDLGKPVKLKNVAVTEVENKLASVVDELVDGNGKTKASIQKINYSSGGVGSNSVEITVTFSHEVSELSFDEDSPF